MLNISSNVVKYNCKYRYSTIIKVQFQKMKLKVQLVVSQTIFIVLNAPCFICDTVSLPKCFFMGNLSLFHPLPPPVFLSPCLFSLLFLFFYCSFLLKIFLYILNLGLWIDSLHFSNSRGSSTVKIPEVTVQQLCAACALFDFMIDFLLLMYLLS